MLFCLPTDFINLDNDTKEMQFNLYLGDLHSRIVSIKRSLDYIIENKDEFSTSILKEDVNNLNKNLTRVEEVQISLLNMIDDFTINCKE